MSQRASAAGALPLVERAAELAERGDGLDTAWQAGDALTKAKRHVGHGEWGAFIAEHFPAGQHRMNELIRLRRHYPDPHSLPAGVGVRRALTLAHAENGARKIRRCRRTAPPLPPTASSRPSLRASLQRLQDVTDAELTELTDEPGYQFGLVETEIDRVTHALLHLKDRLLAREPDSPPCECDEPIPESGYCFACTRRMIEKAHT